MASLADVRYEQRSIPLAELREPADNPRKNFSPDRMGELVEDIRAHGMLEPIIVRPTSEPGVYQVVAGERRRRAAEMIGMREVPVMISLVHLTDVQALELAIAENLRRADLDPIETAEAYARIAEVSGKTQAEIGEIVGKSQPMVANTLRVLKLPEKVKQMVRDGELSQGHAIQLARFAEHPELVIRMAELAAESHISVNDLQGGVPFSAQLVKAGILFPVPTSLPFAPVLRKDRANLLKPTAGQDFGYYTNATKYHEAEAAWKAQEDLRTKDAVARARGKTIDGKPAKNPKQRLPMLADLPGNTYVHLGSVERPEGCSPECVCNSVALGDDGSTEYPVCTDPRRFNRLQKKAEEQKGKERAAQKAALSEWLPREAADITSGDARAMVVAFFFRDVQWYGTPMEKALKDLGIELPDYQVDSDDFRSWLISLGADRLLRLGFAAAFRSELNTDDTQLARARWYIGSLPEVTIAASEEEAQATATDGEPASSSSFVPDDATDTPGLIGDGEANMEPTDVEETTEGAVASDGGEWPPVDATESDTETPSTNGTRRRGAVAAV